MSRVLSNQNNVLFFSANQERAVFPRLARVCTSLIGPLQFFFLRLAMGDKFGFGFLETSVFSHFFYFCIFNFKLLYVFELPVLK